jgi:hypothetical protein
LYTFDLIWFFQVYGIALLGVEGNYRSPAMFMFSEIEYGVNLQNVLVSSSFAVIGKNEFICKDDFTNKTLILRPQAATELFICSRSEAVSPFDHVFKRAHYVGDYIWELGPAPDAGTVTTTTVSPGTTTSDRPAPTGDIKSRIGFLLNPQRTGIKYSSLSSFPVEMFGAGGSSSSTGAGPKDINAYDPNFPNDFPEDFNPDFPKPHEELKMDISDCKAFPDQKGKTMTCLKRGISAFVGI